MAKSDLDEYVEQVFNYNGEKQMKSYGDTLYMAPSSYIDNVIQRLKIMRDSMLGDFRDKFDSAREKIRKCSWYEYVPKDEEFQATRWKTVLEGPSPAAETLRNIYNDDGEEKGGLKGFYAEPNFSHLISAIEELRQAILDYSNGRNISVSRDVLSTFLNGGKEKGDDSFLNNNYYSGSTISSNLEAPTLKSITAGDTDTNTNTTPIFSTDIEKNDELDGADNIPMEDSVTDNITNISAKDLLIDAVKNSNGIVSAGATSVLGNTFSKGIGSSNKIDSKLEAEKIDDIIEPEEPIPNLDEDEDNLFDDVVSTVTSIVTPDVPTTTINGKNVEGKSGSSIAIPAIAGVGVASAGVVGGKVYMDKKNNDDDSEDDDDNKFDDFEFDNTEEKQEEVVNNNDSKENVVDFKNKIMDDNL